jgi:hypothetical protein
MSWIYRKLDEAGFVSKLAWGIILVWIAIWMSFFAYLLFEGVTSVWEML